MKTCSVEGCNKPFLARTWCATHYMRWRTGGDPGEAALRRRPSDPDATEKTCTICGEMRPIDDFYSDKRTRDGKGSNCRKCWNPKNQARRRARLYGLTPEAYAAEVAKCDGVCPLCNQPARLVVDHCHRSGKFRSLLCDRCNRLLGVADDSPSLLRAAIRYLDDHQESQ